MKSALKKPVLMISVVSLLLAACGQSPVSVSPASVSPASSVTLAAASPRVTAGEADLAARQAAVLQGQAHPSEPLVTPQMTDLASTYPGGRALNAQAVSAQADKSVPIVLIPGGLGWGRDEMLGFRYWGGIFDVQEDLRALGYKVFTVSLGPLSSNWDRASEMYVQLKGGCVDYGAAHSEKMKHTRSDSRKCYTGLYPEWDAEHPVNVIGHSLGAPTARLLVKLLDDGSAENAAENNLFVGGRRGWVKSVMTISGVNTGSTATDNLLDNISFLKKLFFSLENLSGVAQKNMIYDFDLGQFGLRRRADETADAYIARAFNPSSPIWTTPDNAADDIRIDVGYREKEYIGRSPYTKYFSWATEATSRGLLTGWRYPNVTMFPVLSAAAYPYLAPLPNGMGNQSGYSPEKLVKYDSSWWENDGLVPVKTQHQPLGQVASDYVGQPTLPGHWYRLGQLDGYDHLDVIGLTLKDMRPFYRNQAAFLSSQN